MPKLLWDIQSQSPDALETLKGSALYFWQADWLTALPQVMIIMPDEFKKFVPKEKEIANSKKVSEALICITVEKREDVDRVVDAAVKSGGKADPTILPQ